MELGVLPPYRAGVAADPDWMRRFARHAEDAGFGALYAVEHLIVPSGYEPAYPYSPTGRMGLPDDTDIPDPLDLLAFLAGHTTRLKLATGVLVLPAHHAVQLAKRAATVDRLSGGRLVLGVGVGWLREELAAVGVEFSSRGRRTDETIDAMRRLWADGEATYAGATVAFERARSHPKPVRRSIPVEVGGHSRAAARRAGRVGDTFHPLGLDDATLGARLDDLAGAAEAAGRDPAAVGLVLSAGPVERLDLVDEAMARADRFGAVRVVVSTRSGDLDEVCRQLDAVARRHLTAGPE